MATLVNWFPHLIRGLIWVNFTSITFILWSFFLNFQTFLCFLTFSKWPFVAVLFVCFISKTIQTLFFNFHLQFVVFIIILLAHLTLSELLFFWFFGHHVNTTFLNSFLRFIIAAARLVSHVIKLFLFLNKILWSNLQNIISYI